MYSRNKLILFLFLTELARNAITRNYVNPRIIPKDSIQYWDMKTIIKEYLDFDVEIKVQHE